MGMFVHGSHDFESPYDVYAVQDTPPENMKPHQLLNHLQSLDTHEEVVRALQLLRREDD